MIDNINKLKGHVKPEVLVELLAIYKKFNITTVLRLSHFMGQCDHESASFKRTTENLSYSASGLVKSFPTHFTNMDAREYAHNQQAIANKVYADRMGNGDEKSGDGWKYKGRGYIQLTSRSNYQLFADFMDKSVMANPDLVATKYPLASAAFFFNKNNLWKICDKGMSDDVIRSVTKAVNGSFNGLSSRVITTKKFYGLLK